MTAVQYIENLLIDEWTSSISGRPHDVGDIVGTGGDETIKIVYESSDEWRRMDLANYDYLTIRDGGLVDINPQSFGWLQEDQISRVDVDIRTKGWPGDDRPGRIALYGERGAGDLDDNEAPRWGGLVGETMRAVRTVRKGDQEFNLIFNTSADDLSSQMGGQVWRAMVQIRPEVRSTTIDTST